MKSLFHTLDLAWRLFVRTVGAKYRKSFLGYFWMVAPALLITAGLTLANRAGIVNPGTTTLPYPLFALIGTLLWHVFAEAMDISHQGFEGARSYLTRVAFSREAIILAQCLESVITTSVRLLLTLALVWVSVGIDIRAVLWVSSSFAGALLLGLGLGSLLMPFTLLFTDLHHTVKLALTYGLFLTPAVYQPSSQDSLFAVLIKLNPVWPLMEVARDAAAGLPLQSPGAFTAAILGGLLVAAAGFAIVRASAPIVIERMLLGGR